jgi:hypothetical protein
MIRRISDIVRNGRIQHAVRDLGESLWGILISHEPAVSCVHGGTDARSIWNRG